MKNKNQKVRLKRLLDYPEVQSWRMLMFSFQKIYSLLEKSLSAINCASKGCPKLQSFAFEGIKLDTQLTNTMREFVNNPQKNKFDSEKKKASLSKIFSWFSDDFKPSVKDFLMLYANEDAKKVLKDPDVTINYLDYDWNLNGE